ncbi:MAG: adenylosuccinate synthetase, partial [Oscillospiraceae bacterium]|nr:adenylosuccinate synthetase [Oscillospiraceae bacterium]
MVLSQIIITDLAAIAILLISALHGRRRGFIKTISGLLALVLAFFLSSTLANATTPHISEKYVAPYINQAIEKGKSIMFEAQLGALRDIDYGIYPYTSASTTLSAYA